MLLGELGCENAKEIAIEYDGNGTWKNGNRTWIHAISSDGYSGQPHKLFDKFYDA